MIPLTALMCLIMGYQVTMPSIDNAKYSFTEYKDGFIKMNTRDGTIVETCNHNFECTPLPKSENK